jgi:rfaE bifunctional protein kinase chain/domain
MLNPQSQAAIEQVRLSSPQGRIVFVSGNFNILHPGHLRLIRFAKECGDYLLVGVHNSDSPGAYLPEDLRLEGIQAIHWVNQAFILHDKAEDFVARLRPAYVVKGNEHEQGFNPEAEVLKAYGGKLIFGSGDVSFTSVDLMRQEWGDINLTTIKKPHDYLVRHAIAPDQAIHTLQRMRGLRVCVIGDTIIDEYINCDPLGLSQEDPTIVVTPVMQERFLGGAGIVAAHARNLGSHVDFFTVLGADESAGFVRQTARQYGVSLHALVDDSRPTTLKQRYRAGQKTLLRVSHLRQHDISSDLRSQMLAEILDCLDNADLLVFADYNYGCLPQTLVSAIVGECVKRDVMMAADSQSSSQIGDVSRFEHMVLITPTEREARLAVQDFDSGLVVLAKQLSSKCHAQHVVITLGAEGLLIQSGLAESNMWPTDRLPALNKAPIDVAGAGDSFLTCASMALATGANIWQASYLGSLAAGCQVGRIGNIPLTYDELLAELTL